MWFLGWRWWDIDSQLFVDPIWIFKQRCGQMSTFMSEPHISVHFKANETVLPDLNWVLLKTTILQFSITVNNFQDKCLLFLDEPGQDFYRWGQFLSAVCDDPNVLSTLFKNISSGLHVDSFIFNQSLVELHQRVGHKHNKSHPLRR